MVCVFERLGEFPEELAGNNVFWAGLLLVIKGPEIRPFSGSFTHVGTWRYWIRGSERLGNAA
jgi:hypothetical protein